MNLNKKRTLAAKTLKVGKNRIVFVEARINEAKEAITKQDVRDLFASGAIKIKEIKGRKKVLTRSKKRGPGKVRKKVNTRKQDYVILTRKLRIYAASLKSMGKISAEDVKSLRKKIRDSFFRSKAHMKDYIKDMEK
jgi:ribosomal protein L19E